MAAQQASIRSMDPLFIFGRGLLVGISVAAPVGPIGMLCIQRTLQGGRLQGLAAGLGATAADLLYGLIAAFGMTAATDFLAVHAFMLSFFGGAFLLYIGVNAWRAQPAESTGGVALGNLSAFGSTFLLTVSNPLTILFFLGVFAALGPTGARFTLSTGLLLTAGVATGSGFWWLVLSGTVGLLRRHFKSAWLRVVNKLAALVILVFAAGILLRLIWSV